MRDPNLMRLSVCMIVKNEAKGILAALDSISEVADEIIIVDTGSTDQTLELIQSYPREITLRQKVWDDNFGAMRNESLIGSKGDWIFILDGDEVLLPSSLPELKSLIATPPQAPVVIAINQIHGLPEGACINRSIVRVFPNHFGLKYHGRIHEQVYNPLSSEVKEIERLDIQVTNRCPDHYAQKEAYYFDLVKQSLGEPEYVHPYLVYQYACFLAAEANTPSLQLKALSVFFDSMYDTLSGEPKGFKGHIWMGAPLSNLGVQALYLMVLSKYFQSLDELVGVLKPHAEHIEFFYFAAMGFSHVHRRTEAVEFFYYCLHPKLQVLFPGLGYDSWRPLYNLYLLLEPKTDQRTALYYWLLDLDLPEEIRVYLESQKEERPRQGFIEHVRLFLEHAQLKGDTLEALAYLSYLLPLSSEEQTVYRKELLGIYKTLHPPMVEWLNGENTEAPEPRGIWDLVILKLYASRS